VFGYLGIWKPRAYDDIMALRSKKRNQEDTKAKLLKAALDEFSKAGYDAATTRNIAKRAGVNESLIHRYFKSKFGLFMALKQLNRDKMIQQLLSYEESDNLQDEIFKFVTSRLDSTTQEKKFFRLVISRVILDPKVREDMRNYTSMKPPELVKRFERLRSKGQIRKDVNLEDVIGVLHSLLFVSTILKDAIECIDKEGAEKLLKTAANILTKGLAPRS
jgi:AcrR family transcriptional regulator